MLDVWSRQNAREICLAPPRYVMGEGTETVDYFVFFAYRYFSMQIIKIKFEISNL